MILECILLYSLRLVLIKHLSVECLHYNYYGLDFKDRQEDLTVGRRLIMRLK